ncbi:MULTISPECIES: epimerase [unclassified Stenotrophomonas]|uniref:epimerase n=1 Tax=unclassified Stenotrophomonas TaxID=196198 RepID=UPI001E2ABFB4|nr:MULTISPECIES: epimerase [unclassified Stenotrophomonas]
MADLPKTVLVLGLGYSGQAVARRLLAQGVEVAGTVRDPAARRGDALLRHRLAADHPLDPLLLDMLARAEAVLCTIPPDADGDPALRLLRDALVSSTSLRWVGYLSSTAVYASRDGGWIDAASLADGATPSALQRLHAERQWQALASGRGIDSAVFRLPGLYGRGRNALVQLAAGRARRVVRAGLVFNRLHVEDLADVVMAALQHPQPAGLYLPADDEPAPPQDVLAYAAQLGGYALPAQQQWDDPAVSPSLRRFYEGNKRIDSGGTRAMLQWQPRFPSYREGLQDAWEHGDGRR